MFTPEHLTVEEAAHALRVKRTKLYQLIGSNQIAAVKLGRRTLITAESARKFLDNLPKIAPKPL
jgi:excisionase family DNA binding protein